MTTDLSSLQNRQLVDDSSPGEDESRELTDVLQRIVENAGLLLEVSNCSVALSDATGKTVVTRAALRNQRRSHRHTRFKLNEGVAGWVAEHREPLVINDVRLDSRFKRQGRTPVGSMICVPLIDRSEFIGTLTASSPQTDAFSSCQLQVLTMFAEQAMLVMTHARHAQQLHAILAASSDGIALVGGDARFREVNPAFGRIFDLEPEQVLGMEYMQLFGCREDCANGLCREVCVVDNALRQERALAYVELDLAIKGIPRSVGLSVTPLATVGKPLCLMMVRDVTAMRDATRVKARFLSMVTHELRAPLNAINGYLDLALTGVAGELNEQQREFMQRARAGSEYLYALLEDLLLISRADAGQLHLNREEISLEEIVTNAVEELEVTAVDNNITITVDITGDVPLVWVDPVRMQQVLRNLLSNALRFTSAGGSIILTARSIGNDAIALQDREKEWVEITVRDTGSGIAAEYLQRIFERFYQVPRSSGGRPGGQGLGLAVVKMIVELHSGQVTVESVPGEGSMFSFTLPCLGWTS